MLKTIEHGLAVIGVASVIGTLGLLIHIVVLSGSQTDQDDGGI